MKSVAASRFSRKAIALGVVVLLGGAAWLVSQPSKAAEEKKDKPQVLELSSSDLARVVRGELRQPVALSGSINPVRQTVLGAEVEGVVAEVKVRPGEAVKAGQLLARFDSRDLADLAATRAANLERSRAELRLAEKNRARSADLLKQNFISPNSHDASENSYAVAAAQVKADEAQLAMARKAVGDAAVRAPFAGVISDRNVEPGARVGINQKLFALVDLDDLEFAAEVPVNVLPLVKIGQEVAIRVEGFGQRSFTGRVERIAPVAQAGSRLVPVYVRIANKDGALRGGMYAQGEVTVARSEAADTLPLSALRGLDSGKPHVLAVEGGKVVEHPIRIGLVNELTKTAAIESGVKPGDVVVIAKLENIKAGQQVKLPAPAAAKKS